MSKVMWIAGFLLIVVGVALGVILAVRPALVVPYGIGPTFPALMLVGGLLGLGLGSVIGLLHRQQALLAERLGPSAAPAAANIPEFGRKAGEVAAAVAATAAASDEVSEPTRDTIKALEQARQKIEQAFEPRPDKKPLSETAPAPAADGEPEVAEEAEAEAEPDVVQGQLYVVEERFIRMRPARILSDGTVEAETSEGWMRFENLEHLDEYLDAMEPAKS